MIYCGYQGCGKSTYCKAHPTDTVDLDSSAYTKCEGWEKTYVADALALSNTGKKVFISAHKVVIEYLRAKKIHFELLIPAHDKEAWLHRLEFRYATNPTQGNWNAIFDFKLNWEQDMKYYRRLKGVVIHEVTAKVVTDIGDFI